ncbi:MAG: hypothetical protein ACR2FN_01640 [Chitinophagaceae bacterium]
MKYFLLFNLLVMLNSVKIEAQPASDSATAKQMMQLQLAVKNLQGSLNDINQKLNINSQPVVSNGQTVASASTNQPPYQLSTSQKYYALMPVFLFLIVFFTLIIWLNKTGFKLGDALQGDAPVEIVQPNPAASKDNLNPATITVSQINPITNQPVLPKSSSRFLALFSGLTAVLVAICLVSFYIYFGMRGVDAPKFDNIFEAILGLGIGIVPYAVNKITQTK